MILGLACAGHLPSSVLNDIACLHVTCESEEKPNQTMAESKTRPSWLKSCGTKFTFREAINQY